MVAPKKVSIDASRPVTAVVSEAEYFFNKRNTKQF